MTTRPRLVTSIPFWILLVVSVAAAAAGLGIILNTIPAMEAGLDDQSASTALVYGGQSWAVVGAALLGAGVIGLALTLAVAAVSTILPRPAAEVVEAIDWTEEVDSQPEATTVIAEPVTTEPLAEDPDVETPSNTPAPAAAEPAVEQDPTRR